MSERLSYQLVEFYRRHRGKGEALALITVLHTEGSTYSKAGSQMLANVAGDFHGMLSGGCLEGDLAERASKVIAARRSEVVEYDLRGDDDVFGLGVGCDGALHVLIQVLDSANDYAPFAALVVALESQPSADLSLSVDGKEIASRTILAPLRVLILGAGLDVEPLLRFGVTLGWEIAVFDHRPAAVDRLQDLGAAAVMCAPTDALVENIGLEIYDAAIVMSHNLSADRTYLSALARSSIGFVGLLGPPYRRQRLLGEIGEDAELLVDRLHGPVGRQIGGRGPAAIALEIVAELQSHFYS